MPPKPTDDELKRIIGSLNADYGLGIQCPDPSLSPRTEEERRVDEIYRKLRVVHFQRGRKLSSCIGQFHIESRQLLEHSESSSRPGAADLSFAISAADRAALQRCLLGILMETALPSRPKPAKRPSDEFSDPQAKRPRSRSGNPNSRQDDVVDWIPVRSSSKVGSESRISPTAGSQRWPTITSYFPRTLSTPRESFASRVFSSIDGGGPPCSQTSFSGSPSQDIYPLCTQEHQALDESFSILDTSPDLGPAAEISPPQSRAGTQTLEQRLKSIWPKLPIHGLNEAPLAVIWEVTRIAQHCGVEPSDWDLAYEPSESWHDQFKLRGRLANHGPFLGKGLPHASEPQAWALALNSFQSQTKAVTLSADLVYRSDDTGPFFELRLNPLKLELGHRLNRRFGADRFIEITMPSPTSAKDRPTGVKDDKNHADKITRWLASGKPHYFLGRSWVSYFIRRFKKTIQSNGQPKTLYLERVYMFAADGNNFRVPYTRGGIPPPEEALTPSIRTKLKLSGLLEWAYRIQHNATQPITKLFSRMALSLTRTLPTVVLERHQIRHQAKDIGTHSVMNDGVGRMSRSLARKIAECCGLDHTPSGYQGRIGSAKGFWIINVDDDGLDCDDWIETYPSQRKWDCNFQDAHHRTFEVKDWPRDLRSAALNQQFIPVLEAQAVDRAAMRQTIADNLINNLLADLDARKASLDHPADMRLWLQQTGQSRGGSVFHGHVPFLAGLPNSDEDSVAYLLDSGFDQRRLKYIQDCFWDLARKRADQLKLKSHIKIPQSANMFMVADFTSTLEEGEVHVSFPSRFQVEGFCDTLLEDMYILVARSPAHRPSDIQKVRVVSHPKLRKLKGLVVFSTKGKVPLADKLSGGDYDGDMAWVCWDRKIVDNFQNAAVPQCMDLFEKGYLSKLDLTFQDLRTRETNVDDMCANFVHTAFSFNMAPSLLGVCTKYKEKLCYNQNAVNSDAAVILSELVGQLVDQSKQGIIFGKDDWQKLCRELIKEPYLEDPDYDNLRPSSRPKKEGEAHILDYLKFEVASPLIERALADFEKAVKGSGGQWYDGDLTKMYGRFNVKAETSKMWRELLKQLRKDIEAVAAMWHTGMKRVKDGESDYVAEVKEIHHLWLNIMPDEKVRSLEPVQVLMEDWSEDPESSQWSLLKASATFKYKHQTAPKFTWRMAGRQLCLIKSKMTRVVAETAPAIVQPEMYASLRPDKRFITARGGRREDESVAAMEEVMEFDDYGMPLDDL
ncbi:RNA-dependent RNA polymerase 1 [Tolypocladium capitatum]|uniref:RNA-dependent RNA polymerase n=1 Tax=Tolypocladium capitatum TaxID=45235 RepID=A0A2K3QQI9_9HYPO|nr:RNA-dependent RNA polymerase 1 [Tolypocladium capitatum]